MQIKTKSLLRVAALGAIGWTGCGPNIDNEDLGEVVFEVPPVAGADEVYEISRESKSPNRVPAAGPKSPGK